MYFQESLNLVLDGDNISASCSTHATSPPPPGWEYLRVDLDKMTKIAVTPIPAN
jgi:hypothetical protein